MSRGRSAIAWTWVVVLLALLLRIGYAVGSQAVDEIAGDINQYVHYAQNLLLHGVYSSTPPSAGVVPVPDTFRPPGYPLFLWATMSVTSGQDWIVLAKVLQVVLSTATVLLVILIGRSWMHPGFAISAGALLAIWPHQVVFASTMLSETLFGFLLAVAVWLSVLAERERSTVLAAGAGLGFGAACLVNSVAALLPVGLLALLVMRKKGRVAGPLLAGLLVIPLIWIAVASPETSTDAPGSEERLAMNFVQGSWPQYHKAWRTQHNNEISRAILGAIDAEIETLIDSPSRGLAELGKRLGTDPARYARWYLLEKPYALWAWDIQLGWRDVYFLEMLRSPYERQPLPKATLVLTKALTPFVFAAAVLALAWCAVRLPEFHKLPFALAACAACFLYFTLLHAVLQAEPRYAVPYRGFEVLLATQFVATAWTCRRRRNGGAIP